MNSFGILGGLVTLVIIGLGFPLVIRGERNFGYWSWPYLKGVGVLLAAASLWLAADWASLVCAVLGATCIWGSTELKEQAVRTELGWFPFNARKTRLPFGDTIKKWKAPHL